MKLSKMKLAVLTAIAGYGSAFVPGQMAFAQEEGRGLEEIVVTAQRREQDLQEVPVSIVALTGENLELQGLDSLEDVGNSIPNLNIQGGGAGTFGTQFRVRGLPNVGVYIDGVWQVGTDGMLISDFVDMDRIEVLRGPQGTTYAVTPRVVLFACGHVVRAKRWAVACRPPWAPITAVTSRALSIYRLQTTC